MENTRTSEFDFFNFETKIRGIVSELIAPTLRRVTNHEESIDKLIKHDNSAQKRLDELDFMTDKTLKKVITIDELSKSLTELRNQKNTQDAHNMFRFESLQTSVDNINHLFENILVNFSSLQDSQLGIRSLVEEFKYSFQNDRKSITEENNKNREEIWNCCNLIREDWEKFRDRIEDNKRQMVDINENVLPAVNKDVEMLKIKIREVKQKIENKNEEIEDKELIRLKKQIQKEIGVLYEEIVELRDFKNKILGYIQTQLPIERLHDISESLSVFLGYEDLVNFINYENSKLEKLKTEDGNKLTIGEIIEKTKNNVEKIDEVRNLRLNNAKAADESKKALLKKENEAIIRSHKSHRSLKNENSSSQIKNNINSSENSLPIKEIIEETYENKKIRDLSSHINENLAGKFKEDQEIIDELPSNSQVLEISEYMQNKKTKNRPKRIRPTKAAKEKILPGLAVQETDHIDNYQENKSDDYIQSPENNPKNKLLNSSNLQISFTEAPIQKKPSNLRAQEDQTESLNEIPKKSENQMDRLDKEKLPKTVSLKQSQDKPISLNPENEKPNQSAKNTQLSDASFVFQHKLDTNHPIEELKENINIEEFSTESNNPKPENLNLTETDLSSEESSNSLDEIYVQLDDLKLSLSHLLIFKEEFEALKIDFIYKADFENLKNDLESTVLFCKASLEQFKSEIDSNFDLFNSEFKIMLKERKQDRYDIQKMISQTQQESRDREKLMATIISQVENISELVASLSEFCRVMHTLILQDEEDRQSIQLTGYSDSSTPRLSKGVVSLKPECITCTGQNPLLLNAFKLACLNYSPTPVKYRYRTYNRRQLIQIMGSFLGSAWNSASTKPPYDSGSFKTLNDSDILPGSKGAKHRASKSQHIDLPSINTSKLFLDIQETSRSYL
ncbi:unnamed protein product [Blepharisma stoltei]|uniref:Uncharacterized protein n=1 Tax=Blepharisma stoltei TaxID=1481888 RepID=A0AAU9J8J7_9CILI|nr:unnamed protein product [Blepharisma stoltei]